MLTTRWIAVMTCAECGQPQDDAECSNCGGCVDCSCSCSRNGGCGHPPCECPDDRPCREAVMLRERLLPAYHRALRAGDAQAWADYDHMRRQLSQHDEMLDEWERQQAHEELPP